MHGHAPLFCSYDCSEPDCSATEWPWIVTQAPLPLLRPPSELVTGHVRIWSRIDPTVTTLSSAKGPEVAVRVGGGAEAMNARERAELSIVRCARLEQRCAGRHRRCLGSSRGRGAAAWANSAPTAGREAEGARDQRCERRPRPCAAYCTPGRRTGTCMRTRAAARGRSESTVGERTEPSVSRPAVLLSLFRVVDQALKE